MPAANAGQAFALVVADELTRHGVTDVVIAPGSRSTPLALAFAGHAGLRVHVRIDERSASFCALGVARASGRPAAVLCTSGTAAAHFHAAVLEADAGRVPLLVLTADRPPELRGVGANQTVDQVKLYGDAVRWFCDVGVPESRPDAVRYWRSVTSRAVATALGNTGPAGPVHLNLPLREPLTPVDDGIGFPHPLDGRVDGAPWTATQRAPRPLPGDVRRRLERARHAVIVAGDGLTAADADAVVGLSERRRWPLVAEPHSNARRGAHAVVGTDALLRDDAFVADHAPDLVLVAGRAGLTRALLGWLGGVEADLVVVDADGWWHDPVRRASLVVAADPASLGDVDARDDDGWSGRWLEAGRQAQAAVDDVLDESPQLTEPQVARDLAASLPAGSALVVASSMPIRDVDLTMRPRDGLRIVANRGVSGIDGFVSTAMGVAAAYDGPTWALAGDLSLLHDANGLLADPAPDLTVVVVNNDGGGIFSLLPQSADPGATFERLFGTPHGVDPVALATAYGARARRVDTRGELSAALAAAPDGVTVLEVRSDRDANAKLHRRLTEAAAQAVRKWRQT